MKTQITRNISTINNTSQNFTYGHIQNYIYISTLFATCVRYFSIGLLTSIIPIFSGMIFLYSFREAYVSSSSMISTACLGIILTELMLFASYFWGAYHFSLTGSMYEGYVSPSTRSLILMITLLLSAASVLTGYAHCLRERGFTSSNLILFTLIIATTFTSLQTSEYLSLTVFINDNVETSILYCLTGLHFFHVFIGMFLILIYSWTSPFSFIENSQWSVSTHGVRVNVLPQLDYFALLYWHFVEMLWLGIQFTLYNS